MTNYGVTDAEGNVTQVPAEPNGPAQGDVANGGPEVVGNAAPAEGEQVVANSQPADANADNDRAAASADAAAAQADEDNRRRAEDPNTVVVREANPEIGGERF